MSTTTIEGNMSVGSKNIVFYPTHSTFITLFVYGSQEHAVVFNPLNAELNPICYLLALLGAHHFLHMG